MVGTTRFFFGSGKRVSDLSSFLIKTSRTLSQMALYSPEHPSVKGSVVESHQLLSSLLNENAELTVALNEGKVLVNGKSPEGISEATFRPFLQLLNNYNLHSLSFMRGITEREMIAFFLMATSNELRKGNLNIGDFIAKHNVTSIKFNEARYAKIGEDETIGAKEPLENGHGQGLEEFENLSLDVLIDKLVEKSVPDPTDRKNIIARARDLIKKEIDTALEKVVVEFNREKVRITSERERTEEVIGTMAEGVVVVDDAGKVLMMNPVAEQIYGVKLGERLGKPLWEGVREEQMIALAKDLAIPTDRPVIKEVEIHASKDVQKTLRASSATVQDINGRVVGMVSVLSDVTKQKELNRLQNEFMANVTHDLRAPIHALKLSVSAVLEGSAGPTTGEQQKMLSMATRNVERLSRLIDDLLDFSKMEAGAMEIRPQVIELSPLLKEAAASMESWSKTRNVTLIFEESQDTPPVFADGDRLLQVVNNLISNAIKFTPPGGKIFLRAKKMEEDRKPMALVEVEDTGTGISKEDQSRIFNRFVQLKHSEKLDIRGTGLGLSICRALVDLHKGKLTVQSPPPHGRSGSLFSFTLPAVERTSITKTTPTIMVQPSKETKSDFWRRLFSGFKLILFLAVVGVGVAEARPFSGTVRRVLGPSLIQLEDGTRVRYLGLDAPQRESPVYPEAVSANRNLVENQEVQIRYGFQERDVDGTWLGYVFANGVFVNEELVKAGLAFVSQLTNEKDFLKELLTAEREARRKKRGLWKEPALPATSANP
jgi:PAS domain S-box-containing protein